MGHQFIIQTDKWSLHNLMEQRILTPEQQKWMGKLFGCDYEIIYKKGRTNTIADTLSKIHDNPCLNAVSVPHIAFWDEIRKTATTDSYLIEISDLAKASLGTLYSWKTVSYATITELLFLLSPHSFLNSCESITICSYEVIMGFFVLSKARPAVLLAINVHISS